MKEVKRYSGVIVKCGDEVLLCKRNAAGSLPGQWSIPGGNLEKDEHPMDNIARRIDNFMEARKTIKGYKNLIFGGDPYDTCTELDKIRLYI